MPWIPRKRSYDDGHIFTIFPPTAPVSMNDPVTFSWSCSDNSDGFCDQNFVIFETLVPTTASSRIDVHGPVATVSPGQNSTFIFTVGNEGDGIFRLVASADGLPTIIHGPTVTVVPETSAVPSSTGTYSHGSTSEPSENDSNSPSNTTHNSQSKAAIIAGSVVGVVVFLALITILAVCVRRHRRNQIQHQPGSFRRDLMIRPRNPTVLNDSERERKLSQNSTSTSQRSLLDNEKISVQA